MMRALRAVLVTGVVSIALVGLLPGVASAWSVSIGSSASTVPIGRAIDVTAIASASLQGTNYELRIFVDGGFHTSCPYTPCTTPVVFWQPGFHTVRGELWGSDPNCGRSVSYCATIRIASSGPRTLTWTSDASSAPTGGDTGGGSTGGTGGGTSGGTGGSGGATEGPTASGTSPDGNWTVLLSASFSQASIGESVVLSSSLNRPLGDSELSLRIVDAATGAILADCSSGSRCQATTTSQQPTSSAFLAEVVRTNGSALVRSDALVISWVTATVAPVTPASSTSGGGAFPSGVILFVIAAALIVGGLVAWAFRAPH